MPDDKGFDVGGDHYDTNPRFSQPKWTAAMVECWMLYRGSGMGGQRILPEAGGSMDQSAKMMDALEFMERCYREFVGDGERSD